MSDPNAPSQPNGENNQPYGQPQNGQPGFNQPPAPPQYGQPQNGQPGFNQPPAPPQYGQPQYQQPYGQTPYGQFPPSPQQGNGIAITALVLGIVAVVFSVVPFVGWLAFLLGPAAIIFGIIGLVKKFGKTGMNITGVVLGAVSVVITIVITVIIAAAASSVSEQLNQTMNGEHAVHYKVTTTGPASVQYSSAEGSSEEEITTAWTKDITVTGFDYFSLSVMGSPTEASTVTCEILINGISVSTNSGTGQAAMAICSGTIELQ